MSNLNNNYLHSSNESETHEYPDNTNTEEFDSASVNLLHPSNICNLALGHPSQTVKVSPLHGQTSSETLLVSKQTHEMTNTHRFSSTLLNSDSLPPSEYHSRQVSKNISSTENPFTFPYFPNVSRFSYGQQFQSPNVTNPLFHSNLNRANDFSTKSIWQAGAPSYFGGDNSEGYSAIGIHTPKAKVSKIAPDFNLLIPNAGKETFVGYNQSNPSPYSKSRINDSMGNSTMSGKNQDFVSAEFRNFVQSSYEGTSSNPHLTEEKAVSLLNYLHKDNLHGSCSRIASGSGNKTIGEDGNSHLSSRRARAIANSGNSRNPKSWSGASSLPASGSEYNNTISALGKTQRPSPFQVPPPPGFHWVPMYEPQFVTKGFETQNVQLGTGASARMDTRLETQNVPQYIGDSSRMGTSLGMFNQNLHPSNFASPEMEIDYELSKDPAWWRKNNARTTALLHYVFQKKIASEQVANERKRKASELEKK